MRFTTAQYAQALVNAIENASRDEIKIIARNMTLLLRQKKHTSKFAAILRETKRRYFRKKGIKKVDVISAAPLSPAIKREVRRIAGKAFVSESVRPEAIAGMSIIVDDTFRVDATAEGIIRNLFKKYEKYS